MYMNDFDVDDSALLKKRLITAKDVLQLLPEDVQQCVLKIRLLHSHRQELVWVVFLQHSKNQGKRISGVLEYVPYSGTFYFNPFSVGMYRKSIRCVDFSLSTQEMKCYLRQRVAFNLFGRLLVLWDKCTYRRFFADEVTYSERYRFFL